METVGAGSNTMTAGEQPQIHSNANAVADTVDEARLSAPSALRNIPPILAAMAAHVPARGLGLEIASGSGQHVVAYGRAFPGMVWQPSDIAADRLASINAWVAAEVGAAGGNVRPAKMLDASVPDWSAGRFDFVTVTNLFHLVSQGAAANVISGAARALNPGGHLFVYGPFRDQNGFRSAADAAFHAQIRQSDPLAGYKDVAWMQASGAATGLVWKQEVEMPASNLSLIWAQP